MTGPDPKNWFKIMCDHICAIASPIEGVLLARCLGVNSFRIRHARYADVPTIMRFILELAEYQNDLHQVTATEESLKRSITFDPETPDYTGNDSERISTSPSRPARCLLIFNESGAAVGMAIFFYSYVTWRAQPGIYLEDFYVSASERGKGYGRKLIGALIEELRAVGGARLEWRVLDWNEASIGFYEGVGSTKMDGWMDMKLEFEGWNP